MNSLINSFSRKFLAVFFTLLAKVILLWQKYQRRQIHQRWQSIKNNLLSDNPQPLTFEEQRSSLENYTNHSSEKIFWTKTSGTRNVPKNVPYTLKDLKQTQRLFLTSMIVLTYKFKGVKTFFVLSSLEEDHSLTAAMLKDDHPSHLELLQAPYRFLTTPDGLKLREEIGLFAARLAVIIVSSPSFLYATNPSTLTHFFDEIKNNWQPIKFNLEKLLKQESLMAPLLKLSHLDAKMRLNAIAAQSNSPDIAMILPGLKAVITWDGGYVTPYQERLMSQLPPSVMHLPMYSMSTESIESLPHRDMNNLYFLPTMPNTYPEFLKNEMIHSPQEVEVGETYTLLITNTRGFIRYDTQDEFLVVGKFNGIPDIRFKRRRNLTASVTGEKVSEEQCHLLFKELKKHFSLPEHFLTLFADTRGNEMRYVLGIIGPKDVTDLSAISTHAQGLLAKINHEYQSKVESGRLQPLKALEFSLPEFAKLMGQEHQWESQFKVMPLYEKPLR